jgi:hypothetical protein
MQYLWVGSLHFAAQGERLVEGCCVRPLRDDGMSIGVTKSMKLLSKRALLETLAKRLDLVVERYQVDLRRYGRGEQWQRDVAGAPLEFDMVAAGLALESHAADVGASTIAALLREDADWRRQWERFVAYNHWAYVLQLR